MAKELTPTEYKQMVASGNKQSDNNNYAKIGILIVVAVVLCGISFAAGMSYQKSNSKAQPALGAGGQNGPAGGMNGFGGGQRPNIGEVKSVSDSSITVSDSRSGSDQTFKITSDTKVTNDGTSGSVSDINTGDTVIIQADSSDSSTASRIILNPNFQGPDTQSGTSQSL